MPDPNAPMPPMDPDVRRRLDEVFKPAPGALPDFEEQFRELERKIREPA
jgi:hypothetical protein